MELTQNARTVLERRYLIRGEDGKPTETVEDLFRRVARAIAAPDKNYNPKADLIGLENEFYDMMTDLEFLPNSPTLMNAGRPLGQLSACFVLPVPDSMEEIFEAIKQAALIHKSGGGTGFSFSRLRPSGSTVNSTGGVASGPVSFMRVFNMATEAVKQGGTRRGANMGILRVDHPDILQFIDCKADNADITNFNISVGITEKFMNAVEAGEEYDLVDPSTGKVTGKLNAKEVFDKIVHSAWRNGEPGIIFLDRLNRDNVVPSQGEIESTNPCGEQPLLPYESCNLGSINLVKMLKFGKDGEAAIDWSKLAATVEKAVHFLDNVIDANRYPLEIIDHTTKQTRKIGLGIMGWADMLLYLGIPYNSEEAVGLADKLMDFITTTGRKASAALAKVRGPFPLFGESIYKDGEPLRNATVTTIAPTGTLSIIAGVSSGVEPVFSYVYIRSVMDRTEMLEVNPVLRALLEKEGLCSDERLRRIAEEGTIAHMEDIPAEIRRVFVAAHDISPLYHIKMQAAFQNHTDNAVSKTVNFPHEATEQDVAEVYTLAFRLGCKGVTSYRDGSREVQVLNLAKKEEKPAEAPAPQIPSKEAKPRESSFVITPRPRPDTTQGITEKVAIGCGNLYITVNYDDYGICEVFTNTGKAGGCPSQSEATARLTSVALRSGINVKTIISQLRGIRCPLTIRQPGMKCTSCPDAIARVIEKVVATHEFKEGGVQLPQEAVPAIKKAVEPAVAAQIRTCPECGAPVEHEGGCVMCRNCGYSKCG
ncbi:MAG TPA: vitamin B12-dependent ribonucleotide reductase [Firmicutes bacterium]|nr:vitamin B12-dependent ribonucleotide reductase [Bacillota bacterium]